VKGRRTFKSRFSVLSERMATKREATSIQHL
jgi:hypothetical protein